MNTTTSFFTLKGMVNALNTLKIGLFPGGACDHASCEAISEYQLMVVSAGSRVRLFTIHGHFIVKRCLRECFIVPYVVSVSVFIAFR